jgi:hypothetical protein
METVESSSETAANAIPSPDGRWYKSKIDWWIAMLLVLPPVTVALLLGSSLFKGRWDEVAISVGALLWVTAIYAGLIFPMRYRICDDTLLVQSGLCRRAVKLAEITEVRPTRNPASSPALSLDRLLIRFGPGFFQVIIISPTPREEFLSDLASQAGLQREGKSLVREPSSDA